MLRAIFGKILKAKSLNCQSTSYLQNFFHVRTSQLSHTKPIRGKILLKMLICIKQYVIHTVFLELK